VHSPNTGNLSCFDSIFSGRGASISNKQVKLEPGKESAAPKGIRYKGVIPFEVRIFTVEWDPDNQSNVVKQQPTKIIHCQIHDRFMR
jgi:hypothetical protein